MVTVTRTLRALTLPDPLASRAYESESGWHYHGGYYSDCESVTVTTGYYGTVTHRLWYRVTHAGGTGGVTHWAMTHWARFRLSSGRSDAAATMTQAA